MEFNLAIFPETTSTYNNNDTRMDYSKSYYQESGAPNHGSDVWISPVDQRVLQDYDQNYPPWPQALHRYVSHPERHFFDAPPQRSYPQSECQQALPTPVLMNTFPHPKDYRNLSPAPSQNPSSSMSSSAHSPGADFDDKLPDMGYYSPGSQNDFLPAADFGPVENGFSDLYSVPQTSWSSGNHVNMSQVQAHPDPHFPGALDLELENDEGFMDFESQGFKMEDSLEQRTHFHHGDVVMDVASSQHSAEWPSDEGLGTSIKDAASPAETMATELSSDVDAEGELEEDSIQVIAPARSPSPASPAPIEEDSDEDESYQPRGTRSRKRRASNTIYQPVIKRARAIKTPTRPRLTKAILPQIRQNGDLACTSCDRMDFKDKTALARHIKTSHLRPYTCVFSFAGCTSTFASKNEWKRHVGTQHLCLHSWICTQDACAKVLRPLAAGSSLSGTNRGAEFNRKDLFTQHLKRMHAPPGLKLSSNKNCKAGREWNEQVKELQESCKFAMRSPPKELRCCVEGCDTVFDGSDAWNERMEHVGKHLDTSANQELELERGEQSIVDQGRDMLLVEWALEQGIIVRRTDGGYRFPREGELRGKKLKSNTLE